MLYIKNKNKYYWKNWDKGLNNTYIINDKAIYPYSIDIPKENCLVDILPPILDFSKILNVNCKIRRSKEQILSLKNYDIYIFCFLYLAKKVDINFMNNIKGSYMVLAYLVNMDDNLTKEKNKRSNFAVFVDYEIINMEN